MRAGSRSSRACSAPWTSVGHGDLAVGQLPRAVPALERAALDQILERLLEEERVAAGALREQIRQRAGQRRLGERLGQLAARTGLQRPQLELAIAVREDGARVLAQAPRRLVAIGAVDEDEPELHLLGQPEQVLDELERERVRPLQVVEDDAQRVGLGEAPHDRPHGGERLLLDGLAAQLAQLRLRLGLEREPEQAGEERIRRLGARAEAAERSLQLQPQTRLRGIDADAEPVAQEVAHGPVGEALGIRARAPFEEADAVAVAPPRLDDEPRLADARLAGDRDDRAAAVGDRLAGLVEHRELARAADDLHHRADLGGPPRAGHARGAQRALDAAQLDLSERLELDAVLHLALGLGPDHDAAVRRELLEPRGDVGGVAERVVAIGAVVVVREHDRAGVDRDAHEQVDAVAALELVAVRGDRGLDRERGAHGALGIVLVSDGRAEEREQPVALELGDGAVEAPDLARDQRDDLVEHELRPLGAQPLADRGRADDVGEHHRDDALGSRADSHRTSYRRAAVRRAGG